MSAPETPWHIVGLVMAIAAVLTLSLSCRVRFYTECRALGGSRLYCAHVATAK